MTTEIEPTEGAVVEDATEPEPEPPNEKIGRFSDPQRAVVEILEERLERVLQPVTEEDVWHGVNVITAKDLHEVTALGLPPASIFAASVRTPAYIYVDALCPVCGIAGEITLEVGVKLIALASSRKLQLTAKANPLPHQCGQMRIRDVTPTAPVATGQMTIDEAEDVLETDEAEPDEPGYADAIAEADALHQLAMTAAPDTGDEPDDLSELPL